MCGFVGILNHRQKAISRNVLKAMTLMVAHRGPDGEGFFTEGPVGLGHRRLAVIDLSSAAAQPMKSECGRYVLAYNGEVYNFPELREELSRLGHRFFSRSDTEVVLKALMQWGPEAIPCFNGMFAFLFLDRVERTLLAARDRYGIKPLYVASLPAGYLFGSEIKSFLKHPDFKVGVNFHALSEYFTFQNLLDSETLFQDVGILAPGTYQTYAYAQQTDRWEALAPVRYWDFSFFSDPHIQDPEETSEHIRNLMAKAVERQMVSDVPLGSYLSGGIDSGLIVALATRRVPRLTTFTGGFDLSSAQGMEAGYDERAAAEILANQFQTEHYEMVLHAGDMAHVMPRLIWHMEELRLGQCYPNYYLARLASKFVKVVLCGTGGDELFAGYPWRYFASANCLHNGTFLRNYYNFWQRIVPDEEKPRLFRAHVFKHVDPEQSYRAFSRVLEANPHPRDGIESNINRSLYFEARSFLHGLLMIEDKLSMAHGLESRVPFLDNDLVDLACRIPLSMKLSNLSGIPRIDENELGKAYQYRMKTNEGKRILRQAIEPLVPADVAERTKQGFSSPDVSWYRGESLDYVKSLLTTNHPAMYDYIEPSFVRQVLDLHLSGRHNYRLLIWSFLSLEWWLRTFMKDAEPGESGGGA
ncbi:MAG: asparagine synthase (glutamine-hydrolyzing) [Deltaproteobacteria bacterium]|nr:asparagine synthase (glutamine-hydrolyzing) [Deltaproteobacteria bacterium]